MLTVKEAATLLGATPRWVRRLLGEGRLAGRKLDRDWIVYEASVKRYLAGRREPGRPQAKGQIKAASVTRRKYRAAARERQALGS